MSLSAKYKKSLEKRWSMRFKTNHPDGDNYDGVVLMNRRSFILLRHVDSFEFDGLILLPKRSICGYQDGKYEKCCNEILRRNGQYRQNIGLLPRWLKRCETIRDVVSALYRNDIWPAIEMLKNEADGSSLYIGPIGEPGKDEFGTYYYDAEGCWEGYRDIRYDKVFRLEFGDAYTQHFNEYMREVVGPPE